MDGGHFHQMIHPEGIQSAELTGECDSSVWRDPHYFEKLFLSSLGHNNYYDYYWSASAVENCCLFSFGSSNLFKLSSQSCEFVCLFVPRQKPQFWTCDLQIWRVNSGV